MPIIDDRKMTKGEVLLASAYFKDSIKYDKVRICRASFMHNFAALAPSNYIYFGNKVYKHDFAASNNSKLLIAFFLHEMTHVWQHQNNVLGKHNILEGVSLILKNQGQYSKSYEYELDKEDLLDYNMEQQAAIIQDSYLVLFGRAPLNNKAGKSASIVGYRRVLKNFFRSPSYARSKTIRL